MLKIMVLDGHASNAATYKRITTDIPGSQVTCYSDLESALAASARESPDVVLIDISGWREPLEGLVTSIRGAIGDPMIIA